MANASAQELVDRVRPLAWFPELLRLFPGVNASQPDQVVDALALALERYMKSDPEFAPFDSKFDQVAAGKASFTVQELRGMAWFNGADKGNCAFCHPSTPQSGLPVLFTDFGFDNLGVPRNNAIADNQASATFFDLGACGPLRLDWFAQDAGNCGKFKAPSLRNVAARPVYFHNGRFTQLKDVIRFYVTRDTNPELWYPTDGTGTVQKFNDLPDPYKANVNITDVPYDRKPGEAPRLTESEIDDLVAFLKTLTDGYTATSVVTALGATP